MLDYIIIFFIMAFSCVLLVDHWCEKIDRSEDRQTTESEGILRTKMPKNVNGVPVLFR